MPEFCRFYGIIIQMFFNDHNPPHFHISYGEFRATMTIDDEIIDGVLPKRALKLVFEWMELHRDELRTNWDKVKRGEQPLPIEPLI